MKMCGEGSATKIKICGEESAKKKNIWGGVGKILPSAPPQDFKRNSPKKVVIDAIGLTVVLLAECPEDTDSATLHNIHQHALQN